MAERGKGVFRLRRCRACNAAFVICRSCDRGQCYCSPECRAAARREQRRRANRRHQHSPEGRLDHRDRQREYRKRCAQRRVTDTSSLAVASLGNIATCAPESENTIVRVGFSASSLGCRVFANGQRHCWAHLPLQTSSLGCVICGRSARFINPPSPGVIGTAAVQKNYVLT
jgi:hypothetical protein